MGAVVCLPVVAPAAIAAGSAATGSTVAAVGSTAAVSGAAVGGATAAATSGSIIEGAALALSGIAGGIIGGSTIVTITSFVEKAESSNSTYLELTPFSIRSYLALSVLQIPTMWLIVICLNDKINESIELVIYYIVICFMKSDGITNPRDEEHGLNHILDRLHGCRPGKSQQRYRADYLH